MIKISWVYLTNIKVANHNKSNLTYGSTNTGKMNDDICCTITKFFVGELFILSIFFFLQIILGVGYHSLTLR